MLGGLVVFSVDRDSQTVSGDCGWMDCSRPSVWPGQGVHHPEVCRDSDQQEHYLLRFWWLQWLLTETFAPGTRTSQWTTGTSGTPHTRCTACPRRWRMRRSWTTQPAGAREGIRAPATGSSPWCLSSNPCSSRSSWLESPCSCSEIWTARRLNSRTDPQEVSVFLCTLAL